MNVFIFNLLSIVTKYVYEEGSLPSSSEMGLALEGRRVLYDDSLSSDKCRMVVHARLKPVTMRIDSI